MSINHATTPVVRLTLTLDRCPHTFGIAPCGAVFDGEKGKCYNTLATCQSIRDYERSVAGRTYQFCSAGKFIPGYNDIIESYAISAPAIKEDYKIWQKERITIRLSDFVGADEVQDDDYQDERGTGLANGSPTVNTESSWWARFIRRNQFFNRRPALFEIGYIDYTGEFITTTSHQLYIDKIARNSAGGYTTIEITDGIKLKKEDGAVVPKLSDIRLTEDLTEGAQQIFIAGDYAQRFDGIKHVSIGKEIMTITEVVYEPAQTVLYVFRASGGSEAGSHEDGDTVELCYTLEGENIVDVVQDILTNYCDLGNVQIDTAGFAEEKDRYLQLYQCHAIIPKAEAADKMLEELQQSGLFNIWFDSAANLIRIRSVVSLSIINPDITDIADSDIIERTLNITEEPRKSLSRVFVYTNPVDFTNVRKDNDKWRNISGYVDATVEAPEARGESVVALVYSRFISPTIATTMAGRMLATGSLNAGKIKLDLPITDGVRTPEIGDNIPLRSWQWVDDNGNPEEYLFRVLKVESRTARRMTVHGIRTIYGGNGFRPFIVGQSEVGSDDRIL